MHVPEIEALIYLTELSHRNSQPELYSCLQHFFEQLGFNPGTSRKLLPDAVPYTAALSTTIIVTKSLEGPAAQTLLDVLAGDGVASRSVSVDTLLLLMCFLCRGTLSSKIHLAFWAMNEHASEYVTPQQAYKVVGHLLNVARLGMLLISYANRTPIGVADLPKDGKTKEMMERALRQALHQLDPDHSPAFITEDRLQQIIYTAAQHLVNAMVETTTLQHQNTGTNSSPTNSGQSSNESGNPPIHTAKPPVTASHSWQAASTIPIAHPVLRVNTAGAAGMDFPQARSRANSNMTVQFNTAYDNATGNWSPQQPSPHVRSDMYRHLNTMSQRPSLRQASARSLSPASVSLLIPGSRLGTAATPEEQDALMAEAAVQAEVQKEEAQRVGNSGPANVYQTIQRSVLDTGMRIFLTCGVCLLMVIAVLMGNGAIIVYFWLTEHRRPEVALALAVACDVLIASVLLMGLITKMIVSNYNASNAAQMRVEEGPSWLAWLPAFVQPTVRRMLANLNEEQARQELAARGLSSLPTGGVTDPVWGEKLRTIWATIGRVAGFDSQRMPQIPESARTVELSDHNMQVFRPANRVLTAPAPLSEYGSLNHGQAIHIREAYNDF